MLEYFLSPLQDEITFFRIFGYTTFRAIMAAVSAMFFTFIFGSGLIKWLTNLKFRESIRDDGPASHSEKAGTPTMGGIIILLSLTVSCFLWGKLDNSYFLLTLGITLLLGTVGFWDDYMKTVLIIPGGMKVKMKFILQTIIGLGVAFWVYFNLPDSPQPINHTFWGLATPSFIKYKNTDLFLPFLKGPFLNLGIYAIPFWVIVSVGYSNAVNLTDGLDGLAIGTTLICSATLALFAYITGTSVATNYLQIPFVAGAHELTVFLSALTGAGLAFLWFNTHPAQIFMGDTGSLALGGALGIVSILLKKEILFLIIGGVFVIEALSVILQVGSYKLRKRRIFKMAPIHHHFELSGWPESRVVVRFWILGIILALMALSTLKIQ
jgi:phospho-N-acetylmuramoyl-pentapeptide-transferase